MILAYIAIHRILVKKKNCRIFAKVSTHELTSSVITSACDIRRRLNVNNNPRNEAPSQLDLTKTTTKLETRGAEDRRITNRMEGHKNAEGIMNRRHKE